MLQVLQEIGSEVPVIGAMNMASQLSSSDNFPLYLRVSALSTYQNTLIIQFMQNMGWKKFGMLTLDNTWALDMAASLEEQAYKAYIEILNPSNMRTLSPELRHDSLDLIYPQVKSLLDSGTKILVLITF